MSGLYIPDKEIPANCYRCEINCGLVSHLERSSWACAPGRNVKCKLLLIPDHGRAIDADELAKRLISRYEDDPYIKSYVLDRFLAEIRGSVTLLPAEKETRA